MSDEQLSDADSYLQWAERSRESWPAGPWDHEPDEWIGPVDHESGVATYARRHDNNGHWCGYVHLPVRHPLWGISYDDAELDVHTGLSYAGEPFAPVGPRDAWALGFACQGAFDISPGMMAMLQGAQSPAASPLLSEMERGLRFEPEDLEYPRLTPRYRTIGYMKGELRHLLHQVTHRVSVPTGKARSQRVRMRLPTGQRVTFFPSCAVRSVKRVPRGPAPLPKRVRYLNR